MKQKQYVSKDDIYQDYQIAIKFALKPGTYMHINEYADVLQVLKKDTGAKVKEFSRSVKNFQSENLPSVGLFVEVPVQGDTGKEIDLRIVMLEHETGPEFFFLLDPESALLAGVLIRVGMKLGEKLFDRLLDSAISKLDKLFRKRWSKKRTIDHVEIRTAKKGVMCLPFSDFDVSQIICLRRHFDSINHIKECNETCFQGKLVAPLKRSTAAKPRLPQADD